MVQLFSSSRAALANCNWVSQPESTRRALNVANGGFLVLLDGREASLGRLEVVADLSIRKLVGQVAAPLHAQLKEWHEGRMLQAYLRSAYDDPASMSCSPNRVQLASRAEPGAHCLSRPRRRRAQGQRPPVLAVGRPRAVGARP
jgi:hypothetical protein